MGFSCISSCTSQVSRRFCPYEQEYKDGWRNKKKKALIAGGKPSRPENDVSVVVKGQGRITGEESTVGTILPELWHVQCVHAMSGWSAVLSRPSRFAQLWWRTFRFDTSLPSEFKSSYNVFHKKFIGVIRDSKSNQSQVKVDSNQLLSAYRAQPNLTVPMSSFKDRRIYIQ